MWRQPCGNPAQTAALPPAPAACRTARPPSAALSRSQPPSPSCNQSIQPARRKSIHRCLLVPQRLDGVEVGRLPRRIDAEDQPDGARRQEGRRHPQRREQRWKPMIHCREQTTNEYASSTNRRTPGLCVTTRRTRSSTRTCGNCCTWATRLPPGWATAIWTCWWPAKRPSRATSPRTCTAGTSSRCFWLGERMKTACGADPPVRSRPPGLRREGFGHGHFEFAHHGGGDFMDTHAAHGGQRLCRLPRFQHVTTLAMISVGSRARSSASVFPPRAACGHYTLRGVPAVKHT